MDSIRETDPKMIENRSKIETKSADSIRETDPKMIENRSRIETKSMDYIRETDPKPIKIGAPLCMARARGPKMATKCQKSDFFFFFSNL